MSEGRVHYEKSGPIGRILFDNPSAHNALSWPMWRRLGEICREIADDPDVRVVTLRGAGGKAFVSGTDIKGFLGFSSGQDGVDYEEGMDSYVGAVEALPVPTIAIVEGWAVGGGLALSFASDFRIASPAARFGTPLARTIGNCLSVKGYARVVAHAGVAQAKRLLLLGEIVTAQELLQLGLVTAIVEPEDIDAHVEALCERLTANAPLTLRTSKEAIRRLTQSDLPNIDDLVAQVYGSADFRMAVTSYLEKRKPEWTGR